MSFTSRRISGERHLQGPMAHAAIPVERAARGWWGWYTRWRERKKEEEQRSRMTRALRVLALLVVAVLLGVIVLAGTVKALVALRVLTPRNILELTGADLPSDKNGFTNFLLLGTGDKDHDGVDLTDTIMVASVDPAKTKSVVLLSIPRDLYVMETEGMGVGRVNQLYLNAKWSRIRGGTDAAVASQEAMRELAAELGRKLGMEIHHVVKVDFTAFTRMVDTVGGIDIEVPEDLYDPEYPGPNYGFDPFSIKAGPQHLDGETALKYARSRHTTSDFDRSARQQQILKALSEKAGQAGLLSSPGKISSLLSILQENVETTMDFGELLGAGKLAERMERQNVISMHLDTTPTIPGGLLFAPDRAMFNGAAVLLPINVGDEPMGSWRQIRAFLHLLTHSRSMVLNRPHIAVLNAGGPQGAARLLANELTRFGFPVSIVGNLGKTASDPAAQMPLSSVAPSSDAHRASAEFFATLLGMPVGALPPQLTPPPPSSASSSSAQADEKLGQVTILLGADYSFEYLQEFIPSEAALGSSSSVKEAGAAADLPLEATDNE